MTIPHLLIDGYKLDHIRQYPPNTTLVFSNLTARKSRRGLNKTVFFGLQYYIKEYLVNEWYKNFFSRPLHEVIYEYQILTERYLGKALDHTHIEKLHNLQYLPIKIMALPEGSLVNIGVPMLVMFNTHPDFAWLVNYLETSLSSVIWGACTSATTAYQYRLLLDKAAYKTGGNMGFIDYQAHDFSFRGMFGIEAAQISGAAHLLSFAGTDSIPAIDFVEKYYEKWPIAVSVPATEHSVMCAGSQLQELKTFERLITEIYPSGIVSIVSDTWDFWQVITTFATLMSSKIMARDGKVVFRPDSGDPVKIICGDKESSSQIERLGAIEVLWEIFGGTLNSKGYKELDPHVGLIYGDSITLERAQEICERLEAKGFASTNVVLGIGSFTYQYVTRDTDGYAVKATYAEIDGQPRNLFKAPKTDDGTKTSAKGLLAVDQLDNDNFVLRQEATWTDVNNCAFRTVFEDGKIYCEDFSTIKERLCLWNRQS